MGAFPYEISFGSAAFLLLLCLWLILAIQKLSKTSKEPAEDVLSVEKTDDGKAKKKTLFTPRNLAHFFAHPRSLARKIAEGKDPYEGLTGIQQEALREALGRNSLAPLQKLT